MNRVKISKIAQHITIISNHVILKLNEHEWLNNGKIAVAHVTIRTTIEFKGNSMLLRIILSASGILTDGNWNQGRKECAKFSIAIARENIKKRILVVCTLMIKTSLEKNFRRNKSCKGEQKDKNTYLWWFVIIGIDTMETDSQRNE